MRIGCQTYTWEMLGERWTGTPDDILDAVAAAGYDGAEFANAMIGPYDGRPEAFAAAAQQRGLVPAAYAFASTGFTDPECFEADLQGADRALQFAAALGVPLAVGGPAKPEQVPYEPALAQALHFYRIVAERGSAHGVTVCVHPHSHHGSLLESAEQYDELLDATVDAGLMFNPDAGHIVRGGQDLMDCFRRHRARIAHVHIKDVDAAGAWQALGEGTVAWPALFAFLSETAYMGWVVAEEESAAAFTDPVGAIRRNRDYLRQLGL